MKIIGVIGGSSPATTMRYFEQINEAVRAEMGQAHNAETLIRGIDRTRIAACVERGQWAQLAGMLDRECAALCAGGAEYLVLASDVFHAVAERIGEGVRAEIIDLVDVTARHLAEQGYKNPALLSSGPAMEHGFFVEGLRSKGLAPMVPDIKDRTEIDRVIREELCFGKAPKTSLQSLEAIATRMANEGADCLVLGCAELTLVLTQRNVALPIVDAMKLHCDAAVAAALSS